MDRISRYPGGPAASAPASALARRNPKPGELLYRFEGRLTDMSPIGLLPEGLRMVNTFEGTVTHGPLEGARVWGVDHFLVRPDGVGVLDAPETFSRGELHIAGDVRGYALPPEDAPPPPLGEMLDPAFEWPDTPFHLVGSVTFRTADPDLDWMNRTVAVIAGEVTMSDGRLVVEARAAG